MASQQWLIFDSGPGPADFNMALDEALLEAMPRLGKPVLRFYGWSDPAASFGYFQKFSDVGRLTPLRPLVRRPTGGGIVSHDSDWTYSMVFPTPHEWYSLKAIESYQRVHLWIQHAFTLLEINSLLAPARAKTVPGQCFVGFEKFDLLWQDRKIAGAAQRRRRDGLLIQGSVQPPVATMPRADWQKAMRGAGGQQYGIAWAAWAPDETVKTRAAELASKKYSRPEYNQGR